MKLKLDENLGRRWASQLRDGGHDVHTVIDEGLSGANDVDVLAAAVAEDRALVTMDLDFATRFDSHPARPPASRSSAFVIELAATNSTASLVA